jgi:hypothetical protein
MKTFSSFLARALGAVLPYKVVSNWSEMYEAEEYEKSITDLAGKVALLILLALLEDLALDLGVVNLTAFKGSRNDFRLLLLLAILLKSEGVVFLLLLKARLALRLILGSLSGISSGSGALGSGGGVGSDTPVVSGIFGGIGSAADLGVQLSSWFITTPSLVDLLVGVTNKGIRDICVSLVKPVRT